MSGWAQRGTKAFKRDTEETSRGRERLMDEHLLIRKGFSGLIFMCNSTTKRDCFLYKVLGLPSAKRALVEQIVPGMVLFLFDIETRELHGIFEASSQGGLNLEPKAFQGQGSYPAQVRFAVYRDCQPLREQVFKAVIQENYYASNKFNHELTSDQVSKLVQLFCPIDAPHKRLLVDSAAGALDEAGGHRLDLLRQTRPVTGGVELANRVPQYLVPASSIRLEGFSGLRELGLRPDGRPLVADGVDRYPVPQTRVLDVHPEQKDWLAQGRIDEVDQLALKYLQPSNTSAGRALNTLGRNASVETRQAVLLSLQQEAIFRSQALESERLRRAAVEQARWREHGSLLPGSNSGHVVSPFAAAHAHAMALPKPLRQAAEIRRR